MMEKNATIYVAGHRGMVGSAIVRELIRQGYENIITRTHKELDLQRQDQVEAFFAAEKPEYVFLAAAKVSGIVANQNTLADFMYDNMTLEMNVIHAAWQNGCKKLEFLGSSCIYPRMASQPMPESCFLTRCGILLYHSRKESDSSIYPVKLTKPDRSLPCCESMLLMSTFPARVPQGQTVSLTTEGECAFCAESYKWSATTVAMFFFYYMGKPLNTCDLSHIIKEIVCRPGRLILMKGEQSHEEDG